MRHLVWTTLSLGISSVFVLAGCATSGGESKESWEPPPWTPGSYELVASVTYRADSELGTRTERMENRAEVIVAPDQTLSFTSTSGLCRTQTPDEIMQDRARGQRSFDCQDAHFILKPMGGSVGGTVSISVQEGIRTKGPCQTWEDTPGGQRVCVAYNWHVTYQTRSKRASLRVMAR
jgi:hypothetical protein